MSDYENTLNQKENAEENADYASGNETAARVFAGPPITPPKQRVGFAYGITDSTEPIMKDDQSKADYYKYAAHNNSLD